MKHHSRMILAAIITLACVGEASLNPASAQTTSTTRTTSYGIEISRETTYLTSPLRADGMADYAEAVNAQTSRGVTPENNAACLLVRIKKVSEDRWTKMPPESLTRMGVDPSAPRIGWVDSSEKLDELITSASTRRWKRSEMPLVVAWLQANDSALAVFTDASKRPQWWVPTRSSGDILLQTGSGSLWGNIRSAANAMWVRSMLKLSDGDEQGACEDLAACERIAKLISTSQDQIAVLVARGLHTGTLNTLSSVIEHGQLSPPVLQQIETLLSDAPESPNRGQWVLPSQRYEFLMQVAAIARDMQKAADDHPDLMRSNLGAAARRSLPDWNRVMRNVNRFCDLLEADETVMSPDERQAHEQAITARLRQLEQIKRDSNTQLRPDATMDTTWLFPRSGEDQDAYTDRVGAVVMAISLSSPERMRERFAESRDATTWTRVALALVRYRQDHGSYPADLNALVPKYLAAPPMSQAQLPVRYERTDNGFVLTNESEPGANPQAVGVITIRRER